MLKVWWRIDSLLLCSNLIYVFQIHSMLTGIREGLQLLIIFYNGLERADNLEYITKIGKIMLSIIGLLSFGVITFITYLIPKYFRLSTDEKVYFESGLIISVISFLFVGFCKFNYIYECNITNICS